MTDNAVRELNVSSFSRGLSRSQMFILIGRLHVVEFLVR